MKNFKQKAISLTIAISLVFSVAIAASAADCTCPPRQFHDGSVTVYRAPTVENWMRRLEAHPVLCRFFGTCAGSAAEKEAASGVPAEIVPAAPAPWETPIIAEKPQREEKPSAPEVTVNFEKAVVDLVNEQRAAYGLAPVAYSQSLSEKARVKSQDMAQNRYFAHNSPTYGTPFEMMNSFGITYRYAGENIARGFSSPSAVVQAWMNSEGHRANILNAAYTMLGVGYVADGGYWTQWFIG